MHRSALLMLLPLLAGCDVQSNHANEAENVSIEADQNGQVAFNLPFAKGSMKLPQSMMHNGTIDIDGVKLMPGSSVTGFDMHGGDRGANVNMTFTAPDSPDEVRSYFVREFKKQGVDAAIAGGAVTGKSHDGSPFTIQVTPTGSGSQGTIVVQDQDKD